jgi:hypothetical protein
MLVEEEPLESFSPFERFQMQTIGEKGDRSARMIMLRRFYKRRHGLAGPSRGPKISPAQKILGVTAAARYKCKLQTPVIRPSIRSGKSRKRWPVAW